MASAHPPALPLVLVIEDDPILMLAMVDFVEQADCEAIEATNVSDALYLLETRTDIRTVFTDLDVRDAACGMQLALAIRDRWPPIELLMISSLPWGTDNLPSRGELVGKPFDQRKIVRAIHRLSRDAY